MQKHGIEIEVEVVMAIIVKWYKTAPSAPIFSRKFTVATIVLIIFVIYVVNLGKMMSVENQGEYTTDEGNAEKFRFVAQLLIKKASLNIHALISTILMHMRERIPLQHRPRPNNARGFGQPLALDEQNFSP